MQIIVYAGDTYLTGDEIADALLAYSRALGDDDRAEVVEIPVQEDDGEITTAKFLIGPASQIVAKATSTDGPELEDPDLVERLLRLARSVESPGGETSEMTREDFSDVGPDYETGHHDGEGFDERSR
ncbi:hypothetical protein [Microbacterium sp. 3J1]|uniref:hypothetical protein n=1 Tax=Microbacterium sp. 3J1 TaxID=861269 RepID=UPI000B1835E7|nr:hypothetical protein [Microbacterium sp. 3J1]